MAGYLCRHCKKDTNYIPCSHCGSRRLEYKNEDPIKQAIDKTSDGIDYEAARRAILGPDYETIARKPLRKLTLEERADAMELLLRGKEKKEKDENI